jgi:hypothetical protein
LRELTDFLGIDDALMTAAAATSIGEAATGPTREELARWIRRLPAADKDVFLLRFISEDGDARIRAEMLKQFRDDTSPGRPKVAPREVRRKVSELLSARDEIRAGERRKKAKQRAIQKAAEDKQAAERRAQHLKELAAREPAAWKQVEALIATKQPKKYDEAVALLGELRDLAASQGRSADAELRIEDIRLRHTGKPSLMERFHKAGFAR